jgi:hypothetical protein
LLVELDARWSCRLRTGGDHEVLAAYGATVTTDLVLDHDGVLVDKAAVAGVELDAVAHQLRSDHVLLLADDVLGAGDEVRGGDVVLDAVTRAVEIALSDASQVQHRLAKRLRWDRAGVGADTAKHSVMFDQRH